MKRQLKLESCAVIDLTDDRDSAVVQIEYSLYDCKAESGRPGPGFAALFGTIKPIENSWYILIRYAATRIGNGDSHGFWLPGNAQSDLAAIWCETNRPNCWGNISRISTRSSHCFATTENGPG